MFRSLNIISRYISITFQSEKIASFPAVIYSICHIPQKKIVLAGTSNGNVHILDPMGQSPGFSNMNHCGTHDRHTEQIHFQNAAPMVKYRKLYLRWRIDFTFFQLKIGNLLLIPINETIDNRIPNIVKILRGTSEKEKIARKAKLMTAKVFALENHFACCQYTINPHV